MQTILGQKEKMSQEFPEGVRTPITKITAGPCVVTYIRTPEKDGYWALQLGFGERKAKHTTKPLQGHFKKIQNSKLKVQSFPRFVREVRLKEEPKYKVGDQVKIADIFVVGDKISVSGTSKGKGFAGGVKRWRFSGGPKTHGQSDRQRAPGSIGQGTTPGRVYKGKHMAGRMGSETVTVKNLKVVAVDSEKNELKVSGPVPGRVGALLVIKKI